MAGGDGSGMAETAGQALEFECIQQIASARGEPLEDLCGILLYEYGTVTRYFKRQRNVAT